MTMSYQPPSKLTGGAALISGLARRGSQYGSSAAGCRSHSSKNGTRCPNAGW